ncbi:MULTISPECIES: polyketide synthase [unclassified Flavobacterium]|jgi:polyketide biosynthesis enoyl-CoA hydratase PksI|uniref:polyketide synthase n=1 Tax=unclassified Flavobacterium TaxID=196869 RepID=UPI00057E7E4E|nr:MULTISPECIES: polyketide synthase [unclassified Flavobacterium]KIA95288.1 polyketide biosynthesis enoyl-CoA hydratase [Flavobacterium sp. KMS]KIC00732.1 polyketide biosynthesis enoyl-CoA hydratase [Flavobacterium sp. JRM]MEA9415800.1 polyketide synthase [Flavobacterium sp. PL02]
MGEVVSITEITKDIVQITMQDKESRNTFSKELIKGLKDAFAIVNQKKEYKVVILTGYDSYFSCGGTQDELQQIYDGELKFTELDFFTAPIDCEIPVIAAMQGHAIGGGLVFGCYADFQILGKENIYTANFMKYGFTPGMGATYMVPLRFGSSLGCEMLFTAESYRGGELQERGVSLQVVPKKEVITEAIVLAKKLAEKPRLSLVILKKHLTSKIKASLKEVFDQELEMHEITFQQSQVKENIKALFGR